MYGPVGPAEDRFMLTDHVDQLFGAVGVARVYAVAVVPALILTITRLMPLPESAQVPATATVTDPTVELLAGEVIATEGGVVSGDVALVVPDRSVERSPIFPELSTAATL